MVRVRLYTGGVHEEKNFVVEGQIPPFQKPPDVIYWGQRCFTYDSPRGADGVWLYNEAFAVALIVYGNDMEANNR